MNIADSVQETTSGTSTSVVVVGGRVAPNRTFAEAVAAGAFAVGATAIPLRIEDDAGNWLTGEYTLTNSTTLTRTAIGASSAAGGDVTLAGTVRKVSVVPASLWARKLAAVDDIAFATAIALTTRGTMYMPQQAISSVLAFTVAAGAVKGALVYLRLVADGTNAPTFTGFKEWGGSLGYDNRANIANELQFFYDGYDSWYSISQAVGAVAEPVAATAVTMTGPTGGVVSVASTNFTVGTNGTRTGSVIVTPTPVTGVTFTPSSVTLPAGTATATFTATPSTTGAKTIAVTNNGGLTNPSNITYTATASATVPATMAAPVATAGDTTASIAYVVPSDGGSALTGYTVTPYIGATAQTPQTFGTGAGPVTVTSLTNGTAYTFKMHASNTVGAGTDSPASNSVTPAAAVTYARLTPKDSGMVESGSGPYVYTPAGSDFATQRGVLNSALQSGVDGACTMTVTGTVGNALLGLQTTSALTVYTSQLLYVYGSTYTGGGAASSVTNSIAAAAGDLVRLRRFGSIVVAEIARTATPTTFVEAIRWTGISTGVLYFGAASSGSTISGLTATGLA